MHTQISFLTKSPTSIVLTIICHFQEDFWVLNSFLLFYRTVWQLLIYYLFQFKVFPHDIVLNDYVYRSCGGRAYTHGSIEGNMKISHVLILAHEISFHPSRVQALLYSSEKVLHHLRYILCNYLQNLENDLIKLQFSKNVLFTHLCCFSKRPVFLRDETIFVQKPRFLTQKKQNDHNHVFW